MNNKLSLSFFAALAVVVAFADPNAPQVTACTVTQNPATHLVTATYTLDEPAVSTFDVKTNGVEKGVKSLTVDGKEINGTVIPFEAGKKEYNIQVVMG